MPIILMRHGKPGGLSSQRLSAQAMAQWVAGGKTRQQPLLEHVGVSPRVFITQANTVVRRLPERP